MIISDLNYVESVEATVVGASGSSNVTINFKENFDVFKNVKQKLDLEGNFSSFSVDNNAMGYNTSAQTFVDNNVVQGRGSTFHASGFAAATKY